MKKGEKKLNNSHMMEGLIGCLSKSIGERDIEKLKQLSSLVLRICPLFQQINRNGRISMRQNNEQLEEEEMVMVNLLNHATLETFQPNSSLFRIKEKSDRLLLVLEGTVELQCPPKVSSTINEMIVCKTLEVGAILGDLDLFLNTARTNTAFARKKTFALALKKIHFDHILKPHYTDALTENMNYVFNLKVFEGISNKFGFIKAFFDTFTLPLSFSLQQYVYNEKDSPDCVYFILSGAFLIQKALPSKMCQTPSQDNNGTVPLPSLEELNLNDHREPQHYAKIYELQKGDFFGEEDIMDNKSHRSSQALCVSPGGGELLSIKREIFEKIFLKHYSIEQFFTKNLPIKRDFFEQKILQYSKFLQEHQEANKSSSRSRPQRNTDSVVLPQGLSSVITPSSQKQISTSQRNISSMYPSFSSYISGGNSKSKSNKRNHLGDSSAEEETTINLKQDSKSSNRRKSKNPGWNSKTNSNLNSQIRIKITNEDDNESFSQDDEEDNKTNNNSRIYPDVNIQESKTPCSVNTLTKTEVKIRNLRPSSAVQSQLGSVTDLLEFVHSSLEMKQGGNSQEVKQQIRISSEDMCAQMEGESNDLARKKLALMNIQKEMKDNFEFDMNSYIRKKSQQSKTITQLKNQNNYSQSLSPQKTTQPTIQSQQTDKNTQVISSKCHIIATSQELKSETIGQILHKEKRQSIDNYPKSKQQIPQEQTQEQQAQPKKDEPQNEASRKFQNNLRKICVQYGRQDFLSLKKSLKNHVKDRSFKQIMNENFKSLKDIPSIQYIDNSKVQGRIADKLNFIASSSQNIQPIITDAAKDQQQLEKQNSGSQSQKYINYTCNTLTSPEKLNTEFQLSQNKITSYTKIQNSLKQQQQQQQSKLVTLASSPSSSSIVLNKGYIDEASNNGKNDYLSLKIPPTNAQNNNNNQLTNNHFNNSNNTPSNNTGEATTTKNNRETETKDPYHYSQLIEMCSQKSLDSIETHQSPQRLIPKYYPDKRNPPRPQTSSQKRIQSSKKLAFSCAHMPNHRKVLSVPTQPTLSNIEWHEYIMTQNNTPKNQNLEVSAQGESQQFQRKSQDAGTNLSSNSHSFQILSPSPQSINPFFPWSPLNSSTPQRERETQLTTQVFSSNILGNQANQAGTFSQNYLTSKSQRILNFQQNSAISSYSSPQQIKGQNNINQHPNFSYNSYPTVSAPQNISVSEENQKNPSSFLKLQRSKQINQQERFENYKEKKQIGALMNMKRANHQQQSLLVSPRNSHSPGVSQTAMINAFPPPILHRQKKVFSAEKKELQNTANKSSTGQGIRSSKNTKFRHDLSEQFQRNQMNSMDETAQIKKQFHKKPNSLNPPQSLSSDQSLSALATNLHQFQSSHSFKTQNNQNHQHCLNSSSGQINFSKTHEQFHQNAQSRLRKQLQFVATKQQQFQQEYQQSSQQQVSNNSSPISGSKQQYLAQMLSQKLQQDSSCFTREQSPPKIKESTQNNLLQNITIDSEQSLGTIPPVSALPSSTLHTPSNFSSSIQNSPQTGNSHFSAQQNFKTNFSSSLLLQKQYSANRKPLKLHRNSSFFHEQAMQPDQLHHTQDQMNQSTDEFLRFHSDHKSASALKMEQFLQSPCSSPSVLKSTLAAQNYAPLHRKALSLFKQQQIQQQQKGQIEQDSRQDL